MIFCHNTYNRPKVALETIRKEKKYFPDAKFVLVYNNDKIDISQLEKEGVDCFYFGENKGHKLGCTNALYSALLYSQKYIENDDDLIVFSHDDIYLSNIDKFKSHIEKMAEYDFVSRKYNGSKHNDNKNYIMLESIIIKNKIVKHFIKDYKHNSINKIKLDVRRSESPEIEFGEKLKTIESNNYLININENQFGENDMGYFHIKNPRGWSDKTK